jgi:hypothetical protein
MRLRMISEKSLKKKKDFFDYANLSNDMWRKKVKEERESTKINFDTENDSEVTRREIVIDQTMWEHTKCKFCCELRSAGGDWENPVFYFRVQLKSGYANRNGKSLLGDKSFVFIPAKHEGNFHLVKTDRGWTAPDGDKKDKTKPNERHAWAALKKHLKKMVDDEIKEVRRHGP